MKDAFAKKFLVPGEIPLAARSDAKVACGTFETRPEHPKQRSTSVAFGAKRTLTQSPTNAQGRRNGPQHVQKPVGSFNAARFAGAAVLREA